MKNQMQTRPRFLIFWKISENHYRICVHKHSKLSVVAHVFTIKLDYGLSEVDYNKIIKWVRSILLEDNRLKENFYDTKSMMKSLGLVCVYIYIYIYPNLCMLYYIENVDLIKCRICGHARYKTKTGYSKFRSLRRF